eukprot:COSAG01_NODE_5931_length_3946_cov_2.829218_1_plen_90_part_10
MGEHVQVIRHAAAAASNTTRFAAAHQVGVCTTLPAACRHCGRGQRLPTGGAGSLLGGRYAILATLATAPPPIGGQCWQRTIIVRVEPYYR